MAGNKTCYRLRESDTQNVNTNLGREERRKVIENNCLLKLEAWEASWSKFNDNFHSVSGLRIIL